MGRRLWTRNELIVSLNLYLKLPFGKLDARTPEVQQLARLINRTPGSVSMRLNNFASVDPYHQQRGIKGLPGGVKQVKPIWDEFINDKEALLFESERILANLENEPIESKFKTELKDIEKLKGKTKLREVKTRVNQHIFRRIVLSNYSNRCAITGINKTELLVAAHIRRWNDDPKNRLNPHNGICMNPLHDKAFEVGLMAISNKYRILLSSKIFDSDNKSIKENFQKYENLEINLPSKYKPSKEFLEEHYECRFQK